MSEKKRSVDGLLMKYFVLKPGGADEYAMASRHAMRAYSRRIAFENSKLAEQLQSWADREERAAAQKMAKGNP